MTEDTNTTGCSMGSKLMFLMLGGGIGALTALLLAPKPGRELRQDIADSAIKGYRETLQTAERMKEESMEYINAAKEKGEEIIEVIAQDAEKISGIVTRPGNRGEAASRSKQIF